jgi:hypothetical protein
LVKILYNIFFIDINRTAGQSSLRPINNAILYLCTVKNPFLKVQFKEKKMTERMKLGLRYKKTENFTYKREAFIAFLAVSCMQSPPPVYCIPIRQYQYPRLDRWGYKNTKHGIGHYSHRYKPFRPSCQYAVNSQYYSSGVGGGGGVACIK